MNKDKQLENIKILAEALRKNLNLTEFSLISFNDELRIIIAKNPPENLPDTMPMLNVLVDHQKEYAQIKTRVLSLIAPFCS